MTPSPISQGSFFKEVSCLIFASSQRKHRGYIELKKIHVTIKNRIPIGIPTLLPNQSYLCKVRIRIFYEAFLKLTNSL